MSEDFKKFLIDELSKSKKYNEDTLSEYGVGVHNTYVYSLRKYDEFHEPVVIPKFMSDWIEENRERYKNTFFIIGYDLYSNAIHPPVDDWIIGNQEKFVRAWFDAYEIEKEPLYHALIKGYELIDGGETYWYFDMSDDGVFVGKLHSIHDNFIIAMSKVGWNKLGINDSNADFIEVEEAAE